MTACSSCAARRASAKRLALKASHALAKWRKTGGNPAVGSGRQVRLTSVNDSRGEPAAQSTERKN